MTEPFRIGPLGGFVDLPGVQTDKTVSAAVVRHGGTHTSLNGGATVDTLGRKRTFGFEWEYLLAPEAAILDRLTWGQMPGPLRLLDPELRNRLSASASDFEVTGGGSATTIAITDPPAGVGVAYATSWARPTTAAATLQGPSALAERAPILAGETGWVSVYVRSLTTSTTIRAGFIRHDNSGGSASTEGSNISLPSGAAWLRISLAWSHSGSYVSLVPQVTTPAAAAAATIQVTGWQVEQGPTVTDWQIGGGAPAVVVSNSSATYQAPGERKHSLDLVEA